MNSKSSHLKSWNSYLVFFCRNKVWKKAEKRTYRHRNRRTSWPERARVRRWYRRIRRTVRRTRRAPPQSWGHSKDGGNRSEAIPIRRCAASFRPPARSSRRPEEPRPEPRRPTRPPHLRRTRPGAAPSPPPPPAVAPSFQRKRTIALIEPQNT